MTNNYEILFIVPKNIDGNQYTEFSNKISSTIKDKYGSDLLKFEKWADRKLAYTINNHTDGTYYLIETKCSSECINELENILSCEKTIVLRFLIDKPFIPCSSPNTSSTAEFQRNEIFG